MPVDDGRDLAIVSDLHLSSGYDERTGAFDRNEDFFYDGAFARFLDHLRRRAESEGRRWRLIILGDLFDFLQVRIGTEPHLDTSTATTLAKLDRIARGHREFFRALGSFAADGFPVDVVPGNHDVELLRESTQVRLRELLVEASGRPEAAANVGFHGWIYYVPGVLYAEHGHQYDDVNSLMTLLRPYVECEPRNAEALDLPLGSYLVEYLFNRIEWIDPFADNVRPMTSYLVWALQTRPIRAIATLGYHVGLLIAVLRDAREMSRADREALRRSYRQEVLRPYADEIGLPYETVVAIDDLAAVPAMESKAHQLRALILQPLVGVVPALAALATAYVALGRVGGALRGLALFAAGGLGLAWREWSTIRPPAQAPNALLHAARRIDALLGRAGRSVPVYVFGHSHEFERFPLGGGEGPAHYLNSGTWTPTVTTGFDLLAARERFTFVEVVREPTGVAGRLMTWNDNAGRAEVLPLLAG